VVDGHPLVRLGVRAALRPDFRIHETGHRGEAIALVRDVGSFDIAIVDLRPRVAAEDGAGEPGGRETIRSMRRVEPALGIVAHGERPDRHTAGIALNAGASAYVSRTAGPEELHRAALAALAQESYVDPAVPPKGSRGKLTRRQREIFQLIANGSSIAACARNLGLSEETVKTHAKNAVTRLAARNRTHAVAIALREHLIE
jgi:DNA-binding NarL/FixJ family response regulator